MKKIILSIMFLFLLNLNLYAKEKIEPSFDCKKASTKVEKLICSDAELAQEDKELNELYNKYMEFISKNLPDYKDIVIKAQRNWMKERNNYASSVLDLKQFYVELRLKLNEAFHPGLSPAKASQFDDRDVEYYYKYLPISYYFKSGYVKDAKNPIYILYNNDEICQNISSLEILDFNKFKSKATVYTEYYREQENGTINKTILWDAENLYAAQYNNGYFGLEDGSYPFPLKYFKKGEGGYYEPYIKMRSYGHKYKAIPEYKSLPKEEVWDNIVFMQQKEPLDDMGRRGVVYTFSLPVEYENNIYTQELTIHNNIEYRGIDFDKKPPVYDKSVVVKVESPLVRIFSYNNDGSKKLACVYTENKDILNEKYKSFFRKYSDFEAARLIAYHLSKPVTFLDYFVSESNDESPYIKQTLKETMFTEEEAAEEVKRQIDKYLAWEKGKKFNPDDCQLDYSLKCYAYYEAGENGSKEFRITKDITKFKSYNELYQASKHNGIYYEYEVPETFPAQTTMYKNHIFVYYKDMVGVGVFDDDSNFRAHDDTVYALVDFELYRKTSDGFIEHIDDGADYWFSWRY